MPERRGPTQRARLRARIRDLEPLALLALFVGVWLLGAWGFLELRTGSDTPLDAAYNAIQLFFLESGPLEGTTPNSLHFVRFAAPMLLGYAAVRGLLLLARGQVARWRTRLLARGHVIVVGESATASGVAAAARGQASVVMIGAGLDHGSEASDHTSFPGPVTDEVAISRARPDRARHVVVATGDDARNLESMSAVQRALRRAARRPNVHVELLDATLWRELHGLALSAAGGHAPVEFFNLADREARALLEAVEDALARVGPQAPAVVAADERFEVPLVSHLVRRVSVPSGPVPIVLLAHGWHQQRDRLFALLPWLRTATTITGVEPDELPSLPGGGELDRASVALVGHAQAAPALALATPVARRTSETVVAVAVSDPALPDALADAGLPLGLMRLVPTREDALGTALFGESAIELIARAKHEDYVAQEVAKGETRETNAALVGWTELPESLRDSNREFARSVSVKLGEVGARIVPVRGRHAGGELPLDPVRLEELARGEHQRWFDERVASGWKFTSGPKDIERKLSPVLIPWEELSEPERDKDRDGYRALPTLLARAGYEVVVAPDDAAAPSEAGRQDRGTP